MKSIKAMNMMEELNKGNKTYYFVAYGENDFAVELDNKRIFRGNWSAFQAWFKAEKNF